VYGYFLISIVLFKGIPLIDFLKGNHEFIRKVNFIPTIVNIGDTTAGSTIDILGNIVLFFPLGVLLQFFQSEKKSKISRSVVIVLIISCIFETIQFIFAIGILDINDLILNTLGGFIGIYIVNIMINLFNYEICKKIICTIGTVIAVFTVICYAMFISMIM